MSEQPQNSDDDTGASFADPAAKPVRPRRSNWRHWLVGLFTWAVVTLLISGVEFRSLPDYQVGDIADLTVKAVQTFTVEDPDATALKREDAARRAPAVFDLDLRVNDRLESELRRLYSTGRRWVDEERARQKLTSQKELPTESRRVLLEKLRTSFPDLNPQSAVESMLDLSFSEDLENQSVLLLQSALAPPGVVAEKDQLSRYRERGIAIRNTVTGRTMPLEDWSGIRDLQQARLGLQQNSHILVLEEHSRTSLAHLLESWLIPNLVFDESRTRQAEEQARQDVDPVLIQVKTGRAIVRSGDEITPQNLLLLQALSRPNQATRVAGRLAGMALLVALFLWALRHFSAALAARLPRNVDRFLLCCTLLVASLASVKLFQVLADLLAAGFQVSELQDASLLLALTPVAAGAALTALLAGTPLALLWSVLFASLAALMTGDLGTVIYALAGSAAAVHLLERYRERLALLHAGLGIGVAQALVLAAWQFYSSSEPEVGRLLWGTLLALGSGLLAAMIAALLLPLLETAFGITTDVRLMELANLNRPLLRRLAMEAPGTFHHSMLVGTLAEAAAEAVGANPLLARVGAYYHDIGKLSRPGHYVENQIYQGNVHDHLPPQESSRILARHVEEGLVMADEIGLPQEVRDLIPQHHGTRLMTFFYRKALDEEKEPVAESDYRYPGPRPRSKEAAILMLADQAEAASRSLRQPGPEELRSLIRRLVRSNLEDGQFDECEITMRDLDRIAGALERVLTGVHHQRVEYPRIDLSEEAKGVRIASPRLQ